MTSTNDLQGQQPSRSIQVHPGPSRTKSKCGPELLGPVSLLCSPMQQWTYRAGRDTACLLPRSELCSPLSSPAPWVWAAVRAGG